MKRMTPSQGVDVIERTESMTNLEKMDIRQETDVIEKLSESTRNSVKSSSCGWLVLII